MTTEKKTIVTIRLNVEEIEQFVLNALKQDEETADLMDDADRINIDFVVQTNSYDPGSGQPRAQVRGMKLEIEMEDG